MLAKAFQSLDPRQQPFEVFLAVPVTCPKALRHVPQLLAFFFDPHILQKDGNARRRFGWVILLHTYPLAPVERILANPQCDEYPMAKPSGPPSVSAGTHVPSGRKVCIGDKKDFHCPAVYTVIHQVQPLENSAGAFCDQMTNE